MSAEAAINEEPRRVLAWVHQLAALFLVGFTIYFMTVAFIPSTLMRYVHVLVGLGTVFTLRRSKGGAAGRIPWFDYVLAIAGVITVGYLVLEVNELPYRYASPTLLDVVIGVVILLLILEYTRRMMGLVLPILVLVAMLYLLFGHLVPGYFGHAGFSLTRVVSQLVLAEEGMFGILLSVYVRIIFVFVLLGTVLTAIGATDFITTLATGALGRFRGGPAYAAVAASAGVGSVSGIAVSNVATTGVMTIPMMKRQGFPPTVAGGIEAAASTGGQLLPPVMGTAAFAMAELTGISYAEIAAVSIMPALLYFGSVYMYAFIKARQYGIERIPRERLPRLWPAVRSSIWLLAPIVLLTVLIFYGFTVSYAGIAAVACAVVINVLDSRRRLSLKAWLLIIEDGVRNALIIMSAVLASGLLLGTMTSTGFGLKITNQIVGAGEGQLLLTLILIYIVSLIFGLGLPVLASYILVAIFAAPALVEMGVPLIAAHLFILWASVDSNLTPPVALASYTAAGISGADPMKTSLVGWMAGKGLYIVPFFIIYSNIAFTGSVEDAIVGIVVCFLTLFVMTALFARFMLSQLRSGEFVALGAALPLLIQASTVGRIVGVVLMAGVLVTQWRRERTPTSAPAIAGGEKS